MTAAVPGWVVDVFLIFVCATFFAGIAYAAHRRDHPACRRMWVECAVRPERPTWRIVDRPPFDWSEGDDGG